MGDIARRRNVAFVGPHHAGKTTLIEALLLQCGAIPRRGSVADGTTTTDHEPESIDRGQSTCVSFAHATTSAIDLTIVDCPGFVEFVEEAKLALLAADAAVIVIDADPGRVRQTRALVEFLLIFGVSFKIPAHDRFSFGRIFSQGAPARFLNWNEHRIVAQSTSVLPAPNVHKPIRLW